MFAQVSDHDAMSINFELTYEAVIIDKNLAAKTSSTSAGEPGHAKRGYFAVAWRAMAKH